MKIGVLITNNTTGNHPADKWAEVTVSRIMERIEIDENSASPEAVRARADKRTFEQKLLDLMTTHHQSVHDGECAMIGEHEHDRLGHSCCPIEHHGDIVEQAVADVMEAAKVNHLFEEFFAQPSEQEHIRNDMLRVDFATSMHINRQEFARGDADHPVSKAWLKASEEHGATNAHHHVGK